MKNNQKGFGATEALLILVIVGIIGGAGWFVYQSNRKTSQTLDKAAQAQVEPSIPLKIDQPAFDRQAYEASMESRKDKSGIFLPVKEWGVKIQMADAAKVTYEYVSEPGTSSNGPSETTILFKIKPELMQDKNCTLGIAMHRTSDDQSDNSNSRKVGGYYYFISGSPYGCALPNGQENVPDNKIKRQIQDQIIVWNIYPI